MRKTQESATQTETAARPDYISALEDIRAISQGDNDQHRTMVWREAVETWETQTGQQDAHARAAFFVYIGIATTDECNLLDELES